MAERRKRIMKRLLIEELERRTMLDASFFPAMASTGLTNNSYEDFYKAQVGTEIGGAAGVGMFDRIAADAQSSVNLTANVMNQGNPAAAFPEATSGVGQMTITTGANTPGISSFATPTAGPSRAGGTGNANLGGFSPAAADRALYELSLELPSLASNMDGTKLKREPRDDAEEAPAPAKRREAAEETLELAAAH